MRLNLSSHTRLTLTGVRDLTEAGRLAAWGTAALAGEISPDEAAAQVCGPDDAGHRVLGLPDEPTAVNLAYALARLRTLGAAGLRLVLPRAGDPAGLPGPPDFNVRALSRGAAVLTTGTVHLGLLPDGRATWSASPVAADVRTPPSVREADRALSAVMREATELLMRLDVARWEPVAAEVLSHRALAARPILPMSAPPQAHHLLASGLRVAAIVDLARQNEGGSVSAGEMQARSRALADLDAAARRAVEAACSPAPAG
jgi:hypothetical protein